MIVLLPGNRKPNTGHGTTPPGGSEQAIEGFQPACMPALLFCRDCGIETFPVFCPAAVPSSVDAQLGCMTFSNAGALKQADSAVQLKGGSVVRMDQDSQYAYVMQHVTKLCGAPADSIQLFWCNAWRKRTLIRPTNSTFPHTVRGAPSTLKSMILNLADTGKPFTLEYEVTAWPWCDL